MAELALALEPRPLSQTERVIDTFFAPSKTFADILRSASWWLPFLLLVLSSYLMTAAIQQKVGWSQLVDNEIRTQPKLEERLANVPPEQLATQRRTMQYSYMGSFYAAPITNLLILVLISVVLYATINFGFGGSATFGRVFAMSTFALLPGIVKTLLAAVLLYAGRSPESFTLETMIGSNPGYYLETPGALKTLLTSLDVFTLWTAVLLGLGLAVVARKKTSSGLIAVFGWFMLIVLVRAGWAAATA